MNAPDPVDLMRQFWLAGAGEAPRGPYTLEQIGVMFRSGAVYATAQVCEDGDSAWRPVTDLRREFPAVFAGGAAAPRPAPPVAPAYNAGVFRVLALLLGFIGGHNFYAGDVGAGLVKLLCLVVSALAPVLAGELGLVLSWGIFIVVLLVLVLELIRGESIPSSKA